MKVTSQVNVRGPSLTLIVGSGGPLNAVTAALINAPFSPSDLSVWADVSGKLASFTGSTPILITWSAQAIAPNRQPFVESQLLLWICTAAPAMTEQIYGVAYYLVGTPNLLLGVDMFDTPIPITLVGDSVQWVATVP